MFYIIIMLLLLLFINIILELLAKTRAGHLLPLSFKGEETISKNSGSTVSVVGLNTVP